MSDAETIAAICAGCGFIFNAAPYGPVTCPHCALIQERVLERWERDILRDLQQHYTDELGDD